jgi:hypothetical protein
MFNISSLLQKGAKFGPFIGSAIVMTGCSVHEFQQQYTKLYGSSKLDGNQTNVANKYNIFFALGELFICGASNYQPSNFDELTIARQVTGDSWYGSESDSE